MAPMTVVDPIQHGPSDIDLEGAEACRKMLATIEGLADVQGTPNPLDPEDDGIRRDYAAADRAIAEAFNGFASSRGFRQALCNYFLTVQAVGEPDLEQWTPKDMFDDCGFRSLPCGTLLEVSHD